MLREIHKYTWLSNWFMGRGLKKGQNDRMTHINIDLSSYWISIILFLWKEFRLKKLKNMQICKFYFSKYVREQTNQWHRRHNGIKIILKSHNNFLCFWKFTKHFFIFCVFCLQKTLNRKLTQIELLVRPKKKNVGHIYCERKPNMSWSLFLSNCLNSFSGWKETTRCKDRKIGRSASL